MASNVIQFTIKSVDKFSANFDKSAASMKKLAGAATIAATALAAFGVAGAKQIVDVGNKTEQLRLRMNSMLGSVGEGNKVFSDMSKFASQVPFAYEDIMASATQLSGVLKGGSDEINSYMPVIADLAAVSGLSIQQTTEQVVRMYSAGAGAADLFRERGITSMLGFKAGVSYSAEETRKKLIGAWNDVDSKFRGASESMAETWDGVMSMIGDKWFQIKQQIADAGLFNFIKAIAMEIDRLMGEALQNTADNATVWSNHLIDGIRSVMSAVGFLANAWRGLEVVWAGLKLAFAKVAEYLYQGSIAAAETLQIVLAPMLEIIDRLTGTNLREGLAQDIELMNGTLETARERTARLKEEFDELALAPLPGDQIDDFMDNVEIRFAELQAKSEEMRNEVAKGGEEQAESIVSLTDAMSTAYDAFIERTKEVNTTFAESLFETLEGTIDSISTAVGAAIVEGESLTEAFKNIAKNVMKEVISSLVKMGIQRLILAATNKVALTGEASAEMGKAISLTGANMMASMSAAPYPINLSAPAMAAAWQATAGTLATTGFATGSGLGSSLIGGAFHGGIDNVPAESTYLLDKGERVLSPRQNKDLTSFLQDEGGGGGVTIENVQIDVLPNATNVESLLNLDESDWRDLVAGPLIDALNTLNRHGIRPESEERTR